MHNLTANRNAEIQVTDIKDCKGDIDMTIEELFKKAEGGTLTFEQFKTLSNGAKFVDLSEGNYVSKNKYTEDLNAKDTKISGLEDTIKTRDSDLKDLQDKLKAAGTDADKLAQLTTDVETWQTKYNTDIQTLQEKLDKQAYEFAVKEFAATKKFTSNAAKRDFINSMIAEGLKMDKKGRGILGAEDFVTNYSADNSDAFVVENPTPEPPKPQFVNSTQGGDPSPTDSNAFLKAFNFTGVRPMPNQQN